MRLSIITIAKENAEGLKKTLTSCVKLHQELGTQEIEQIIIDASPGEHKGLKDRFKIESIRWIEQAANGIYSALNLGNKNARGEIIWHLHAGDELFDPQSLIEALCLLENESVDVLFSPSWRAKEGRNCYVRRPAPHFRKNLIAENRVSHAGVLFRRSCLDALGGFNEKWQVAGDYEWLLRVSESQLRTYFFDKIFSRADLSGISQTNLKVSHQEVEDLWATANKTRLEAWQGKLRLGWHRARIFYLRPFFRIGSSNCI